MLAAAAAWQLVAVVILAAIVAPLIKVGRPGMARRRSAAPAPDWRAVRREAQAAAQLRRSTSGTLGALPTLTPKTAAPTPDAGTTVPGPDTVVVGGLIGAVGDTVGDAVDEGAGDTVPGVVGADVVGGQPAFPPPSTLPAPTVAGSSWPAPAAPWQAPVAAVWPAPAGSGWPSPRRRRRLGRWAPPSPSARRSGVLTPESAPAAWDLARHPRTVW